MLQSLPSRERGLKFVFRNKFCLLSKVAPLAGAWIEIWHGFPDCYIIYVAPLAGAWIEILVQLLLSLRRIRRSPRGSVD